MRLADADNIASARRIPEVLSLVGLQVVPANHPETVTEKIVDEIIENNIEILSETEHLSWMNFKQTNGWRYGKQRDDRNKIHNCIIEYNKLTEIEK